MITKLAAVITAGGRVAWAEPAVSPPDRVPVKELPPDWYSVKALLEVGGRTLLERVLEAVWCRDTVKEVVVVGSPFLRCWLNRAGERLLPERGEAHENLIVGLQAVAHYPRVLYLTSDLPFVTAHTVNRFIDACASEAQLCYAIVRREAFDARFPNSPSTYARLKDGEFVAGCAALIEPAALLQRAEWISRASQRRKSLWRLALLAGSRVLWRYATRQLTVTDLEGRAQELLGMRCRAVECEPELAYDIDTPQEYAYARSFADARTG